MPAGPKQQVSALFADGEGISTYSKKKGPSWFYLQWASNKANQTRMLQAAAGAPVRTSAYAAAQASSDFKSPKEWVECMLASAKIAQPGLPIIAAVTEFRDTFGIALTNMINGADPATELKKRDGRVPAGPRQDRESLTPTPAPSGRQRGQPPRLSMMHAAAPTPAPRPGFLARRRRSYLLFVAPALLVVGAVIIFPWAFTVWMSAFDWKIGSVAHFVGFENYIAARDQQALSRVHPSHVLFHAAGGDLPADPGHHRRADLPSRVSVARHAALDIHDADDGHAGRGGAGVDDDVPSATGRAQLPAVAWSGCRRRSGFTRRPG